jgi:hypothetical protein
MQSDWKAAVAVEWSRRPLIFSRTEPLSGSPGSESGGSFRGASGKGNLRCFSGLGGANRERCHLESRD